MQNPCNDIFNNNNTLCLKNLQLSCNSIDAPVTIQLQLNHNSFDALVATRAFLLSLLSYLLNTLNNRIKDKNNKKERYLDIRESKGKVWIGILGTD